MSTHVKKYGVASVLAALLCGATLVGPTMASGDSSTSLRGNSLGLYQAREAARWELGQRFGEKWTKGTDRFTRNFRRLSASRVRVYYSFHFIHNNNPGHKHGYVLVWRRNNNKPLYGPNSGSNRVDVCPNYRCPS